MKKLAFTTDITAGNLIRRVNEGKLVIAPPKVDPVGGITLNQIADVVKPKDSGDFIAMLLKRFNWLIILLRFLFRRVKSLPVLGAIALVLLWLFKKIPDRDAERRKAEAVSQDSQYPDAVDRYRKSPDFLITAPGSGITPSTGRGDSDESKKFKAALKDVFRVVDVKFTQPQRKILIAGSGPRPETKFAKNFFVSLISLSLNNGCAISSMK